MYINFVIVKCTIATIVSRHYLGKNMTRRLDTSTHRIDIIIIIITIEIIIITIEINDLLIMGDILVGFTTKLIWAG